MSQHDFQADVATLLDIVTESLYADKEVFIRELVSNASDALEKRRVAALSKTDVDGQFEPAISVSLFPKTKQLVIEDNGVGMSAEEVKMFLGTIAHSGTREFLKELGKDKQKASELIGQFGVGFYSAFVVSNQVCVETRRMDAASDQGVKWVSSGKGHYEIEQIAKESVGTRITLDLKEDASSFLDFWHVRNTIKRYSDHINAPITLIDHTEGEGDNKEEGPKSEVVNEKGAFWLRPKSELKDEDYHQFYSTLTFDQTPPLAWVHERMEGNYQFSMLLYIPTQPPFDLWNRDSWKSLKLYVKRVFIMDDSEKLLPMYLRFVRGLVDADDLPLNVSRELLQSSQALRSIRGTCVKRVLSTLEKMAKKQPEDYAVFWKTFGAVLKEGPAEDMANAERLYPLLRFASTHNDSDVQDVSLDDYISRMKDDQEHIYFLTAEHYMAAKNSPHLEALKAKGYEVLLLTDRVDEWLMNHLTTYQEKPFKSAAKGELDADKSSDESQEDAASKKEAVQEDPRLPQSVLERIKDVLAANVESVRVSKRLTESPCCLVAGEHDISSHLKRMLESAGQQIPDTKPVLELNPEHPMVRHLLSEQDESRFGDWSHLLYEQAVLLDGAQLSDPAGFVKRINHLVRGMLVEPEDS